MRRTGAVAAGAVLLVGTVLAGTGAAYGGLSLFDSDEPAAAPTTQVTQRPAVTPTQTSTPTPKPSPTQTPTQTPTKAPTKAPTQTPSPSETPDPGGRVLLQPGDEGPEVRELQARLRQIAWFSGNVTDHYGEVTEAAVAGFQGKRGFPVTGVVDERTMERLEEMSTEPTADELANVPPDPAEGAALDSRCLTGRVLCIDKSSNSLRWVVDGEVELSLDARFGGNGYVTREGSFSVFHKSRDHVSSIYDTSMPFALFFDGGRAVHYSPDFAANGYAGASHGCVNIRDFDAMAGLFDEVRVGDSVVVYWS